MYYTFPGEAKLGSLPNLLSMMDDLVHVHWGDIMQWPDHIFLNKEERWSELDELMDSLCKDIPKFLLTTQEQTVFTAEEEAEIQRRTDELQSVWCSRLRPEDRLPLPPREEVEAEVRQMWWDVDY